MNDVVRFLLDNPVQFLATVGTDGKAKCRPFAFCCMHENKLWFCTNSQKEVYKELQANPYVELSAANSDAAWLRISGKVMFENNMPVKEQCLAIPLIKSIYETPNNPIFEVFYLADATASIADFSGNPPKEYTL